MSKLIDLPDEDLAGMAQGGDKDAESALCSRYWEKAGIIARSYAIPGVLVEDKESECLVALVKAVREWRPGRGTKFRTFAKMLMIRALTEVWRDVKAAGEVPRHKLVSIEQSIDGQDDLSMEDMLASLDDPVGETLARLEAIQELVHLTGRQRRRIAEAVAGGAISSRLARSIHEFARATLSPQTHADIVDLIRDDCAQPRLIAVGPEPGSADADELAQVVLGAYQEAQWYVMCDLAEGYDPQEIATRRSLPKEVVTLMLGAGNRASLA